MHRSPIAACAGLLLACSLHAAQSTIIEAEGTASMGDDKTRKQTEQSALADAKRNAVEYTLTYLKSETRVKDGMLESDLIEAFANASVNVIQVLERKWHRDEALGDCFTVRIKAEVVPDERAMAARKEARAPAAADDPAALLAVSAWAEKGEYRTGEKMKCFIRGNKPFYARVVYQDAAGALTQLLPNPYRTGNYFNGGTVYEIPSGEDAFDLEVASPYGSERITVYASTQPLGDVALKADGGVYRVTAKAGDVGSKARGIKIREKGGGTITPAEFSQTEIVIRTQR